MSMPAFHSFQLTSAHQRALVHVLLMCQRRRLDPAIFVDRLATEFSHGSRLTLRQVARLLAEGTPVVDALEQTPGALDPSALLLLQLSLETGTFPESMQSLIAQDAAVDPMLDARAGSMETQLIQTAGGFLVASLVVSFLMLFIVPTIEKMFYEFGITIPASMVWFITIGRYVPWLVIPGFIMYLTALLARPLLFSNTRWRFRLGRRMPQAGVQLLDLLSVILQSGRPLSGGIATLSRIHPVGRIRRRLVAASRTIHQGENEWRALVDFHFISETNGKALQQTDDRLTQSWLLRRTAKAQSMWQDLRSAFIVRSLSMILLLMLAAVVTLAAVGMFTSIYRLVESLA